MKLLSSVLALSKAQNLLLNGDFTSETGWSAHGGLDLVYESEANGINYAKVGSRTANWQGMYQEVTANLDPNQKIYVASFTTKIVADIDIADEWDPWTFGFGTRASIKLERDVDGQTEVEWVNCGNVCTVPDGEWIKHTGNCYLPSIENVANAYFTLSGLDSQHEMFISDASFQPFTRNRDWVPAADLRIDELRKIDLRIDTSNLPSVSKIELEMTDSDFIWGAMVDTYMEDEVSNTDDYFKLFNMGVARNEMKWESVESNLRRSNWSGDRILEYFQQHNTDFRGHTVFWSVDGHSPDWYEEQEGESSLEYMEEKALEWMEDVITRYSGTLKNWDVFNEVIHGNFFRRQFGKDWANKVFDRIRQLDPSAELGINDYNILSGSKGKCFRVFTEGAHMDFHGLQSHFKGGIDGQLVQERLNEMAGPEMSNRLMITEFDVEEENVEERAEDVQDFLRSVFSHPNAESVIMWSWLREVQRPWQEEPFNRALFEDNLDFGDEKVASEWPLSPNKAGKAYLDLVKGEWNSTMTLENVENIENLRVFKGNYKIRMFNDENEEIYNQDIAMNSQTAACDLLNLADFEDNDYLESDDIVITDSTSESVEGGYKSARAALISNRESHFGSPGHRIDQAWAGMEFHLQMAVKLLEPEKGRDYKTKVMKVQNGEHVLVYEATIPAEENGAWHMDDTPFNVETGDEYFYLTFDEDYLGDFLIDQLTFALKSDWDLCASPCARVEIQEFEDASYIGDDITIIDSTTYSVEGGFTGKNAGFVSGRESWGGSPGYKVKPEMVGTQHKVQLFVKMLDETDAAIKASIKKMGSNGVTTLSQVDVTENSQWFRISAIFNVEDGDEFFFVAFDNYEGDFLMDRFTAMSLSDWNACYQVNMIAEPLSDECNEVETFGFADNSYVTDENTEIVACETYMTDIDAYSGTTSGLVTERTQSWGGVRHLLSEFPAGTELKMKMAVKILNSIEGERYDAQIIKKKSGNKYPSLKQYNNIDASDWLMIDVDILVEEGDEYFYLTFGDYLGDYLMDNFLIAEKSKYDACSVRTNVQPIYEEPMEIWTAPKSSSNPIAIIRNIFSFFARLF